MPVLHHIKRLAFSLNWLRIKRIIALASTRSEQFFFVQIGASDGKSGDPLHDLVLKHDWQCLMVEPIKYAYNRLTTTYNDEYKEGRVHFENAAIANKNGSRKMFRVQCSSSPNKLAWYERIASFDKNHVLKHINKIKKQTGNSSGDIVVSEDVRCITFGDLLKKHQLPRVDLLQIDAEGYDYEVIKMIPFSRVKPRMILYENKHLSSQDKADCKTYLKSQGYRVIKAKDTFAYIPLRKRI